ncbi:MAG TPA: hypothetical protein PLI74_03455, partial [Candidatus Kapabacteria bacterium]|nr:hypothetical protein [Candidatus Kapabacteria bacterium]
MCLSSGFIRSSSMMPDGHRTDPDGHRTDPDGHRTDPDGQFSGKVANNPPPEAENPLPEAENPPKEETTPSCGHPSGGGDKDKREKDEDMQAKEAEQILTAQEQQHTDIRMRRTKGKKRGAVLFFAPSCPSPRGRYNKILPVGEKKRGAN